MSLLLPLLLLTTPEWFSERLYEHWNQTFKVDEVIYKAQSDFEDILIFENSTFGRVLALDGIIQLTEKDEPYYHEMIAHIPLFTHPNPKKILIIGGGDGGTAREVLKHSSVESVTLVEIDLEVVLLSKKYFPKVSNGAFEDPRLTLKIEDGARFVAETDERFDVILVDSSDPVGPGVVLYEKPFFANCARCLSAGGLFVNHSSTPFINQDALKLTSANLPPAFPERLFFQATVPTYVLGPMLFTMASKEPISVDPAALNRRIDNFQENCKVYNRDIHQASFALSNELRKQITDLTLAQ